MAVVTLSERALRVMRTELRFHERVETGGFLLGYMRGPTEMQVLEAIDGGYQNIQRSANAFEFDDAYVQHVSTLLCNAYDPPLSLIGMWHKHCHQMDPPFSLADDALHRQLMAQNDGRCISILFQQSEECLEAYRMRTFVIDAAHGDLEVTLTIE